MYVFVCWYIYICQSLRTDQEHRHSLCGPERQTLDQTRANTCVCVCANLNSSSRSKYEAVFLVLSGSRDTPSGLDISTHTHKLPVFPASPLAFSLFSHPLSVHYLSCPTLQAAGGSCHSGETPPPDGSLHSCHERATQMELWLEKAQLSLHSDVQHSVEEQLHTCQVSGRDARYLVQVLGNLQLVKVCCGV